MLGALVVFCVTYLVIASRQLHWIGLDRPAGAVITIADLAVAFSILYAERALGLLGALGM